MIGHLGKLEQEGLQSTPVEYPALALEFARKNSEFAVFR